MKILHPLSLFAALALTIVACSHQPENPVKTATIKHTELGRQTMFKINPESFDQYFKDAPTTTITSKAGVDSLVSILNNLTGTEDTGFDMRARIILTHADNKTDTAFVGVSETKYKGNIYKTPQTLLQVIEPQ